MVTVTPDVLGLPRSRFRRGGFAHYWVLDPAAPSFTAWHLVGEGDAAEYELVAEVRDREEAVLDAPFPLRVVPFGLVER